MTTWLILIEWTHVYITNKTNVNEPSVWIFFVLVSIEQLSVIVLWKKVSIDLKKISCWNTSLPSPFRFAHPLPTYCHVATVGDPFIWCLLHKSIYTTSTDMTILLSHMPILPSLVLCASTPGPWLSFACTDSMLLNVKGYQWLWLPCRFTVVSIEVRGGGHITCNHGTSSFPWTPALCSSRIFCLMTMTNEILKQQWQHCLLHSTTMTMLPMTTTKMSTTTMSTTTEVQPVLANIDDNINNDDDKVIWECWQQQHQQCYLWIQMCWQWMEWRGWW